MAPNAARKSFQIKPNLFLYNLNGWLLERQPVKAIFVAKMFIHLSPFFLNSNWALKPAIDLRVT